MGAILRYVQTTVSGRPALRYSGSDFNTTVSVPLTEAANDYSKGQGYLAPMIAPFVPAGFGTTWIPLLFRGDVQADDLSVGAGCEAHTVRFNVESVRFGCERYAAKVPLSLEMEKDNGAAWSIRERCAGLANQHVMASLEKLAFNAAYATTNTYSGYVVKSAMNANGDAFGAVTTLVDNVQNVCGYRPDVVVFGPAAYKSFGTNSSTLAKLGGRVTPGRLAEAFRVDSVFVHDGAYAVQGGTFASYMPTDSILAVRTKNPSWMVRPYHELPGIPSGGPYFVEMYPEAKTKTSWIECGVWMTQTVLDKTLGATLLGCNSSQTGGL